MSDDEDRPHVLYDAELVAESDYEAEQRRGRARMLNMWRAGIQCLAEAAQREAAGRSDDGAGDPAPIDQDDLEAELAGTTATWVFPVKPTTGPGN